MYTLHARALTWKFGAGLKQVVSPIGRGGDHADDGAVLGEAGVGRLPSGHGVDRQTDAASAAPR